MSAPLTAGTSHDPRDRRAILGVLLLGLVLFVWGRTDLPPEHFSNADIAGITYNADLLVDHRLPYVDSIEGKAPGTFFIAAVVFALFGRSLDALWWVFLVWQLLGAPALWVAARALYGREARLACAVATALYLASAGQFDLSYSSWMTTAYAWAFGAALVGLRSGSARWHVFAGLCAIAAFLLKRQAVVLVPLFPVLFLWAHRRKQPGATGRTWGWWSLGAFGGAVPLLLFYGDKGYLPVLFRAVFPLEAITSYAAMKSPLSGWELLTRVLGQCYEAFPLAVSLCLANLVVAASDRRRTGRAHFDLPVAPQLVFIGLSMFAGSLGGPRFYQHYLIQDLPGLALLAARPGLLGYLRGARAGRLPRLAVAGAIVLALVVSVSWHAHEYATGQAARRYGKDFSEARRAGEYIAARTSPDETIMVWGWNAWPTYYWANRRAPVNGYKSLGLLTDPNTNSAFFPSAPVHFRPGIHADALLQAFVERPPAYFVYTTYYTRGLKLKDEPLFEWTEFRELVERDYVLEVRFGDTLVLTHRSRWKDPRTAAPVVDDAKAPVVSDE